MRAAVGGVRVMVAVTVAAAIFTELIRTSATDGRSALEHVANYFSYFTTMSNSVTAVTLAVGAWYAFRSRTDPVWYDMAFSAVVTYMMTTGTVYNLALRAVSTDPDSWANEVLHVFGALFVAGEWLSKPGKWMLPWRRIASIVAVPVVWLGYTMVRGGIVGWYPYAFLDPTQPGGYATVIGYAAIVAGIIVCFAAGAVATSRLRPQSRRGRKTAKEPRRNAAQPSMCSATAASTWSMRGAPDALKSSAPLAPRMMTVGVERISSSAASDSKRTTSFSITRSVGTSRRACARVARADAHGAQNADVYRTRSMVVLTGRTSLMFPQAPRVSLSLAIRSRRRRISSTSHSARPSRSIDRSSAMTDSRRLSPSPVSATS